MTGPGNLRFAWEFLLRAVVDGKMGIGIYGPALDAKGNSIAGRKILQFLSSQMKLHIFAKKD